jgi:very-short-patch-repair endonuclease
MFSAGFEILKFSALEIMHFLQHVLQAIYTEVEKVIV